ncbi:MAG TPA: hypothetical protein DIT99_02660 [Candidatus Latescibacteria bacterium]|nr:hypothetical protein [Candidatus Latescibacterota bacterium]
MVSVIFCYRIDFTFEISHALRKPYHAAVTGLRGEVQLIPLIINLTAVQWLLSMALHKDEYAQCGHKNRDDSSHHTLLGLFLAG